MVARRKPGALVELQSAPGMIRNVCLDPLDGAARRSPRQPVPIGRSYHSLAQQVGKAVVWLKPTGGVGLQRCPVASRADDDEGPS